MTEEKTILDKAKELAIDIKDKVSDLVSENEEKIDSAIDKTHDFVDDKTKGKYTDKIDRAQEAAKSAVSKVAGSGSAAESPAADESPAAASDEPAPTASDAPTAAEPEAEKVDPGDAPEGGPTDPAPNA